MSDLIYYIDTVEQLVEEYEKHNPSGHFFDADTMDFFHDTLENFEIAYTKDDRYIVLNRINPVTIFDGPDTTYGKPTYFDSKTFELIYSPKISNEEKQNYIK